MKKWLCYKDGCYMRIKERNREYMNMYRFSLLVEKMKAEKTLCQVCTEILAETIHHKDENHNNNSKANRLPICRKCHLEIPHESDHKLDYGERVAEFRTEFLKKAVTRPKSSLGQPQCVTAFGKVVFKKGNLVVVTQVSIRVQNLFEDWGFERLNRQ